MENNKLIPMTEFVKQLGDTPTFDTEQFDWCMAEIDKLDMIRRYANFLRQPLTLGQFIPCDDNGNVLSEPIKPHTYASENCDQYIKHYKSQVEFYQYAKERILFEGCKAYKPMSKSDYYAVEFGNIKLWLTHTNRKIEDLDLGLTLTPTALKMIYGTNI